MCSSDLDMTHEDAIKLVRDSFGFIASYEGEIPGSTEIECGNYKEHNLEQAREDVKDLLRKIKDYKAEMLEYSWHNKQV